MYGLQICKDKDEAEVWFVGLKASVAGAQLRKSKFNIKLEGSADAISPALTRSSSPSTSPFGSTDNLHRVCVNRIQYDIGSSIIYSFSCSWHRIMDSSLNLDDF
jgi:hypothetical protein